MDSKYLAPDLWQHAASTVSECFKAVHELRSEVLAIPDPMPKGYEAIQGTLIMNEITVGIIFGYLLSSTRSVSSGPRRENRHVLCGASRTLLLSDPVPQRNSSSKGLVAGSKAKLGYYGNDELSISTPFAIGMRASLLCDLEGGQRPLLGGCLLLAGERSDAG